MHQNETRIQVADQKIGLRVSRSLGDTLAQNSSGVIEEPELSEYMVEPNDTIIILASCPVSDNLSNERVGLMAHSHYAEMKCELGANAILAAAYEKAFNQPGKDDITCIVVFLDKKLLLRN